MKTANHTSQERLVTAWVTGTAGRHASRLANGRGDFDAAIAELRGLTTDAHLLAHGIGSPDDWAYDCRRALLEAAGADMADLDEVVAEIVQRTKGVGYLSNLSDGLQGRARR